MIWATIDTPADALPPDPITVRAQSIPGRSAFLEHSHPWHQVVYAVSGVLSVAAEGRSFAISPEQAVWLPTGHRHRVGSFFGAEFRSLWIADELGRKLPCDPTVIAVAPLLRALILEAAEIQGRPDGEYASRVTALILDQLQRAKPLTGALPWPREGRLVSLCEELYAKPSDLRGPNEWGRELGMSARTLARRFDAELGMSFSSWRRRLRLFKAVELLGSGMNVTRTAQELGYRSTSAFVYAFRTDTGRSPQAYVRATADRHRRLLGGGALSGQP